ncbi:MAG: hypothetical protein U5K51_00370 [Flavobacteriaceae bacterium]|nr:hypothetical protein [Flavobacteriaceae bacterium]
MAWEVGVQDQIAINKKSRAGVSTKNILAKIKGYSARTRAFIVDAL